MYSMSCYVQFQLKAKLLVTSHFLCNTTENEDFKEQVDLSEFLHISKWLKKAVTKLKAEQTVNPVFHPTAGYLFCVLLQ